MAKMKKMPRQNPPEPNPFIQCKMSETHIVTTSNPASPEEPQPTRAVEPLEQQIAPMAPVEEMPIVVIQPASSGEEEREESEEREEAAEPEQKTKTDRKRKKKEKKMKKDKKTKR